MISFRAYGSDDAMAVANFFKMDKPGVLKIRREHSALLHAEHRPKKIETPHVADKSTRIK